MSYDELTAELKNLKKRLYTFKLKGMELHQRARNHISTHRRAELVGHGSIEEYEKETDLKFAAFGPHPHENPVSNEYILEMIAYYLPLKDLQNCKKVCKLWSQEFERCEMKRKSIVVASDEDTEAVMELVKEKRKGNLISLSTLVILSTSMDSRAVRLAVNNFGLTLSSLRLDECRMTATELYCVLRDLPCLDHLSVKTNDMIRRRNVAPASSVSPLDQITSNAFTPTLVLDHLRELVWEDERAVWGLERLPVMCPNLIAIQIANVAPCEPTRFRGVTWKSLKTLDFNLQRQIGCTQSNYFRSFAMMGLNLKKICLRDVVSIPQYRINLQYRVSLKKDTKNAMKYFTKFLEGSQNSLEGLRISRSIPTEKKLLVFFPGDSPLPVYMPQLKSLTIDMEFITSLDIVDHLPSLEKLICTKVGDWMNWYKLLRNLPKVHTSLFDLTLGAIDAECLRKVISRFPKITILDIAEDRVDDKLFSTICSTLPKVKILRIGKTQSCEQSQSGPHLNLTDVGITGIPLDAYSKSDDSVLSEDVESLRVYPNIRDLKELQILEINYAPDLSDMSLFHGVVGMESLLVVHLPKCKITDASLKKFPNLTISSDTDGGRRIRVMSIMNPKLHALIDLASDSNVIRRPLSVFGEMVSELGELREFHDCD